MNTAPSRGLIGAAIAFTIALFLFGSALVRAFSTDATLLPPPARAAVENDSDVTTDANRGLTADALQLAVENDPFSPAREAPAERYRLPGDYVEPEPEPAAEPPPPPPPPPFQLSGTVLTENASMALISVGDVPPRMMHVGESLMGYRLSEVTAQTATMTNEENNIMLRVPTPSRTVAANPRGNTRGQPQPQRGAGNNATQAAVIQQLLERARQAGASPQMLESLMRMVSERGIGAIENLEIGPNGFTIRSGNNSTVVREGAMRMETPPNRTPQPARPQQTLPRPRPDTMMIR